MYSETERQYHLRVLNSILVMTVILTRKVAISDALPLEAAVPQSFLTLVTRLVLRFNQFKFRYHPPSAFDEVDFNNYHSGKA